MLFIDDNDGGTRLSYMMSLLAALLFLVSMISDIVDGYLARRFKVISNFGKLMDPFADKMLFMVAMIMMVGLGRMSAWIVALFFMREVGVTTLRAIAIDEGIIVAASSLGKYKSAFVSSAVVGLLIYYPFFNVHWYLIGHLLLIPSLILSIASGVQYCVCVYRKYREKLSMV